MRIRPWVPWLYMAPALIFMAVYLVYPMLNNIWISFFDRFSKEFIGLENYIWFFTNDSTVQTLYNNVLWLILFVGGVVFLGLVIAVMVDRVRYEKVSQMMIFMPMGISAVGGGIAWRFVYAYAPKGEPQTGILNAIVTALGGDPVAWTINQSSIFPIPSWSLNDLMIIIVAVWIWTGFAMVYCSASYKALPKELRESALIDGASEWQIFWRITIPMMRIPLTTITVAMVTFALKLFDEVYVMTGGNYGTRLLALDLYNQLWSFNHFGRASSIAVILLLAILPFILYNIWDYRRRGII
jgi:alpha-glucoside transport system permease protein